MESSKLFELERLQKENIKLKTGLEEALEQLKSLREEAKNTARAEDARGISEKISEEPDDVWSFISDVRENYQLPLA